MKLPRLITRRRAKWVGLVVSVVLLGVACASIWYLADFEWQNTDYLGMVIIKSGAVDLTWGFLEPDSFKKPGAQWIFGRIRPPRINLWFYVRNGSHRWGTLTEVRVPLWLPLLLIAAPTAWLWYTDRRAKHWQCPKCRYDLRGIEGGVCPECGGRRS